MEPFFHSVRLISSFCQGCTNCIKRCPTEAIRVKNGKAVILSERCIDCGECIHVCPYHAKRAQTDSLKMLGNYTYNVALPAPVLYGQFNNLDDADYVLTAFKKIGFDGVFEVARAAELVSEATRVLMNEGRLIRPVISSACPAVCRLIRVRFPNLCDNVLPLNAPMEEAARLARIEARELTGLPDERIGVFFITPCPAKMTDIRQPIGAKHSNVTGAFAISDIYPLLVAQMDRLKEVEPLSKAGIIGVSWAGIGGEASALLKEQYLAADGVENVIKVLEEVEDDKLRELDFIELNACAGGCVGGVLTVENPFVAMARIQRLRKYMPVSCNHLEEGVIPDAMCWSEPLQENPVLKLADNVSEAMRRMNALNSVYKRLPGIDCGTCGAPTCRVLAEDIVRGWATETDCIFRRDPNLKAPVMEHVPTEASEEPNGEDRLQSASGE